MANIIIENYNPNWAKEFTLLKTTYEAILKEYPVIIEHVGSTSVEGLAAKPILDIDIIIQKEEDLVPVIEQLEKVGYQHLGDMGIVGREAFKRLSNHAPIYQENKYEFSHHLYVCKSNATSLKNHLLFRDYLKKDDGVRQDYANLKRDLAIKYSHNMDLYCEAKTEFITSILKICGLEQTELNDITSQNISTLKD